MPDINLIEMASLLPCGILLVKTDKNLTIVDANERFYNMLGFDSATDAIQFLDNSLRSFIPDIDISRILDQIAQPVAQDTPIFGFEALVCSQTSGLLWMLFSCRPIPGTDHLLMTMTRASHYHSVGSKFTSGKMEERGLLPTLDLEFLSRREFAAEQWDRHIRRIQADSLMYLSYNLTSDTCLNMVERIPYLDDIPKNGFEATINYTSRHLVNPRDRNRFITFFSRNQLITMLEEDEGEGVFDFLGMTENDDAAHMRATVFMGRRPFYPEVLVVIYITNLDESESMRMRLQEQASTDPLTGLLNRSTFIDSANELFSYNDPNALHALIMLDLDNFKTANDTLGHATGDAILRNVAMVMRSTLRSGDLIGRLGGDEFIICLKNIPDTKVIEKRVGLIGKLIHKTYGGLTITITIGISMYPQDGRDFDELYRKADKAMYKAKQSKRFDEKHYAFYTPDMDADPDSTS